MAANTILDIKFIVTYREIIQKHRKISSDSVDTLNSHIKTRPVGQELNLLLNAQPQAKES